MYALTRLALNVHVPSHLVCCGASPPHVPNRLGTEIRTSCLISWALAPSVACANSPPPTITSWRPHSLGLCLPLLELLSLRPLLPLALSRPCLRVVGRSREEEKGKGVRIDPRYTCTYAPRYRPRTGLRAPPPPRLMRWFFVVVRFQRAGGVTHPRTAPRFPPPLRCNSAARDCLAQQDDWVRCSSAAKGRGAVLWQPCCD